MRKLMFVALLFVTTVCWGQSDGDWKPPKIFPKWYEELSGYDQVRLTEDGRAFVEFSSDLVTSSDKYMYHTFLIYPVNESQDKFCRAPCCWSNDKNDENIFWLSMIIEDHEEMTYFTILLKIDRR